MAATQIARTIDELRRILLSSTDSVALSLTRGFLHEGHRQIILAAKTDGCACVVGTFLHQRQFAPGENVALYPRDPQGDEERARAYGADVLWQIDEQEAFPHGFGTEIRLPALERTLAGVVHPEVLRMHVTLTVRLSRLAGADALYFGELDWYKAHAVQRALRDLAIPAEVRIAETARDAEGIAHAALNARLQPDEIRQATKIYAGLREAQRLFQEQGECEVTRLLGRTSAALTRIPGFRLQYVHLMRPETLVESEVARSGDVLMVGGFFGRTRLADAVRLP